MTKKNRMLKKARIEAERVANGKPKESAKTDADVATTNEVQTTEEGTARSESSPKKAKEDPKPKKGVERDRFGSRKASQAARINKVLNNGMTTKEVVKKTNQELGDNEKVSPSRIRDHLRSLVAKGFVVTKKGEKGNTFELTGKVFSTKPAKKEKKKAEATS